jgi:nucleoside-diphosphate-sugar epimerase
MVTSCSGKLARALTRELLSRGRTRANLDWAPPPVSIPEDMRRFARIDFTDCLQTVKMFTAIDGRYACVDGLVHLATSPGTSPAVNGAAFANNTTSNYKSFAAARNAGNRNVVWTSSEALLGIPFETPQPYLPVNEECPAQAGDGLRPGNSRRSRPGNSRRSADGRAVVPHTAY